MPTRDVARVAEVALSMARDLGLRAEEAVIVNASNKVSLRSIPCDVFVRVAPGSPDRLREELVIAQALLAAGGPVVGPSTLVPVRVHERSGFSITFWEFHETLARPPTAAEVADSLGLLHAAWRRTSIGLPRFTGRVGEALDLVTNDGQSPDLAASDRTMLIEALVEGQAAVLGHGAPEQGLHGEPHPGNVLLTGEGLRFIDFETCCRGPVEFDAAHLTAEAAGSVPGIDADLLDDCRGLVLAMVAAWRCDPADRLPDGDRAREILLAAVRRGPPWPTLDEVMAAGGRARPAPRPTPRPS